MAGSTYPFTDGSVITAAGQNSAYETNREKISTKIEIYTGSTFDSSAAANSGTSSPITDEQSYEMTAISAADLVGFDYIDINMAVIKSANSSGSADGQCYLKIQTKEIAGAYADSLVYVSLAHSDGGTGRVFNLFQNILYTHTLTAGEKSAGIQIKVFSKSYADDGSSDSGRSDVTNVQTSLTGYRG